MIAAREGHEDTVVALLSCGADPFVMDTQGMTAHAFALVNGHVEVCALLA
jgi:ankyrin repeat protein